MSTAKPTVFISYSHLDEEWKDKLLPHLKAFEKQGDLLLWHDRRIDTGADWYPEIRQAVERARVAVCLITANFLTSDFIAKEEVPALLKRREAEDMAILPLLVSPCPWQRIRWLKGIQMFPPDNNCISPIRVETEQKQLLADFAVRVVDQALAPPRPAKVPPTLAEILLPPVEISRLPVTGAELFGREAELELLDSAWEEGKTKVLCFVAWGGVGKSILVNRWLAEMATDNYRGPGLWLVLLKPGDRGADHLGGPVHCRGPGVVRRPGPGCRFTLGKGPSAGRPDPAGADDLGARRHGAAPGRA